LSTETFEYRSCYINFAAHLLNAYNPNVLYPQLPHRWSQAHWQAFIDMIADFGFNTFEFWLVPRLFSPEAFGEAFGQSFIRDIQGIIDYAHTREVRIKMLCALATVGSDWHAHCPNDPAEWRECLNLWDRWTSTLRGLGVVGIFPGDPGGCSRNGCTAETYIDAALEVTEIVKRNSPQTEIELNTWGSPFFAWGTIQGPPNWKGEFIQKYQHTAWTFDAARTERAMNHLIRRLPDFPEQTRVAINLAFNPDGNPDAMDGAQDARGWARQIAKHRPIVTWDFSLTEGENAIVPHYRFERLFTQRRRERQAAPYSGGICYTMTPMLNQLSLYQSAQSFIDPHADHRKVTQRFLHRLFGPQAEPLADLLPLFEIVPDWGNHADIDMPREQYHRRMNDGADLIRSLKGEQREVPFHPSPSAYRQELEFFFQLFADLTGPSPDFDELHKRYWQRVYAIYDHLPEHVDPRPKNATDHLIHFFDPSRDRTNLEPLPGKWID
jgi:hypothetical protein